MLDWETNLEETPNYNSFGFLILDHFNGELFCNSSFDHFMTTIKSSYNILSKQGSKINIVRDYKSPLKTVIISVFELFIGPFVDK